MNIHIETTKDSADYQAVCSLLNSFGMSDFDASTQEKIFRSSYAVSFMYDGNTLIGCARAISDGICEAAVYNVALAEEYHGQKLGRELINSILSQVKGCNVILYTHPRTIGLYEKLGFRRQKTGMAIYQGDARDLIRMEEVGFLLPEGYRFGDNEYEKPL